jgi:hypothetical protein
MFKQVNKWEQDLEFVLGNNHSCKIWKRFLAVFIAYREET